MWQVILGGFVTVMMLIIMVLLAIALYRGGAMLQNPTTFDYIDCAVDKLQGRIDAKSSNEGLIVKSSAEGMTRAPRNQDTFSVANIDAIPNVQHAAAARLKPTHEEALEDMSQRDKEIHNYVMNQGISDDVRQNHRTYVDDILIRQPIPGASHQILRDDFSPPNPFWGLKRNALHAQLGAMGDARQVQSETTEQVIDFSYKGNEYLL